MTEPSKVRGRTTNYKSCFFRNCGNTTVSASEKIFIPVPKGEARKDWIQIVRGVDARDFSLKSSLYCCEDHFNLQEDLENYTRLLLDPSANVRLKKGALPKPSIVGFTISKIVDEEFDVAGESTEEIGLQHQFAPDITADIIDFDETEQKPNIDSKQLNRSIGIQTDNNIKTEITIRKDTATQTDDKRQS